MPRGRADRLGSQGARLPDYPSRVTERASKGDQLKTIPEKYAEKWREVADNLTDLFYLTQTIEQRELISQMSRVLADLEPEV